MNIALGAVFIFILLLPPLIFYFGYTFGNDARPGSKFSLLDSLLLASIFSLIIHALGTLCVHSFFSQEIRFDLLLKLVGGEIKDVENKISNSEFRQGVQNFALYNSAVNGLAFLLGIGARYWVKKFGDWGKDNELLRLKNNWWYLFTGYNLPNGGSEQEYECIFLDALVDTNSGSMLYSGILVGYICYGEELDRIYLSNAERRELRKKIVNTLGHTETIEAPGDAFGIEGELLSIPYSQIKNLNLRFIRIQGSEAEFVTLAEMTPTSEIIQANQQQRTEENKRNTPL